jgi:hypothetical protein
MRLAKHNKALPILSMAIATTLGAKSAHGATLSLYYDNIFVLNNIGNVVQSYYYGQDGGDYSQIPTIIHVGLGDTVSFGIDAVVTNNINPDAGKKTGHGPDSHNDHVQPSFLGLSMLSIVVPSTDTSASKLVPNTDGTGPHNTFGGAPDYNASVSLNNDTGAGTSLGPNNGALEVIPAWGSAIPGDVSPTSNTGGDVGDHVPISQSNTVVPSNNTAGVNALAQYGAATATFGNATDFFDSLTYTALTTGTVVLSPSVVSSSTGYWTNTQPGSVTVPSVYSSSSFTKPGDVIGTLPKLVIETGPILFQTPLLAVTPVSGGHPGSDSLLGNLTVSGHDGNYSVAELTGLNAATGYVEVSGFNPASDEEIYAMDVLVNGTQANSAQIQLLISEINSVDVGNINPPGLITASTYAGLGVTHDASPFASQYNLFLDTPIGPGSDNFLSFNFGNDADPYLFGYTVSAVAVVPEPMTFSLITLGVATLLTQRPRHRRRTP